MRKVDPLFTPSVFTPLCSQVDPTNAFHHIFFFGDLNYRLDAPMDSV